MNQYYKKYLGTVRRWLRIHLESVSLQHCLRGGVKAPHQGGETE